MFKLINFISKESKNKDIKVIATGNFLDNIKKSTDNIPKDTANEDKYFQIINKGIKSLANFTESNNSNDLKTSIQYFINAQEIKNSKPESYFFLSYIANMMEDFPVAINYLHAVEAIDPNFVGLSELKSSLNENLSSSISH